MKKVVKFGGTSLACAEQIRKAARIIKSEESRRYVIASAPGKRCSDDIKVTDMLYRCYDAAAEGKEITELLNQIKERFTQIAAELKVKLDLDAEFELIGDYFRRQAGKDYAASRGEYLNSRIIAAYLGFKFIDAAEVVCFDEHGVFDSEKTDEMMRERLKNVEYAVIPGFYGAMPDGSIKTFSRGGSDITGSIVARAVKADVYENWTDVSGVMVTDPRIVSDPEHIETITYRELRELSYMGASVLHEDAIFPVRKESIPINIRNTNQPEDPGTLIVQSTCRQPKHVITGIAGKKGFCSIYIEKDMMNSQIGFGRRVLQVFEENGVSFEHMPSGIDTMTVLVHQSEFVEKEQSVIAGLHRAVEPDHIELTGDLALLAIVGRGMKQTKGVAAKCFTALMEAGINIRMIDQGSSELNIIIGVKDDDLEDAIRAIYRKFITEDV